MNTSSVSECIYEIIGALKEELELDDIHLEDHVSLVAVVGRGMKAQPGMSGKLLSEFGLHKINIKTISQTADELSIVVGVKNEDYEKAISCIYEKFIAEERKIV